MAKIAIIGLGIVGSAVAAALAQTGHAVTAFEQFNPLHERGSSHGDTRIFRRVPFDGIEYIAMAEQSYPAWHDWNRAANEALFVETGGLDLGSTDAPSITASALLYREYKVPHAVMGYQDIMRRWPHFVLPQDVIGYFQPQSGYVRPDATMAFLHRQAKAHGALLHFNSTAQIEAIHPKPVIVADGFRQSFDYMVLASGGWLGQDFAPAQKWLRTERRVLAWLSPTAATAQQFTQGPVFTLVHEQDDWYGMPTPDGLLKIGHHLHQQEPVKPGYAAAANAADTALLGKFMHFLRGFNTRPTRMASCIYSLTPDNDFIIDTHPDADNILLLSCCSGHGFKYAPSYGHIAVAWVAGQWRRTARFALARLNTTND